MLRAFQWDLARQVERLPVLLDLLPRYASWGYSRLFLHLEDCVEYPSLPGLARADAYPHAALLELCQRAAEVGIAVVPIVNLLGHTQYVLKCEAWRDLNELRDETGAPLPSGQICPLHPRFPDLLERLLDDCAPFATGEEIHAGLDESFHLGKCPACREEVNRVGLAGHFANHVQRVHRSVSARGLRLGLWGDMLALFPEAAAALPPDVSVYDWYYYPFPDSPRLELHGFRDYDLPSTLHAPPRMPDPAGSATQVRPCPPSPSGSASHAPPRPPTWWACPMSGAFRWEPLPIFRDRLENARSWWRRATSHGAEGFLVTSWEAYRVAFPIYAVVDAAIASLWLDGPELPAEEMLARGFERNGCGETSKALAKLALQADAYPFSGYYEWETNSRWDGGITLEPLATLQAAELALADLAANATRLTLGPSAAQSLAASLGLRRTFAARAVFIREAVDTVAALRRALFSDHAGIAQAKLIAKATARAREFLSLWETACEAAAAMWDVTRDPEAAGPNGAVLEADFGRVEAWLNWLSAVLQRPARARSTSPVFGEWQLCFIVGTDQPCVQRISVEVCSGAGEWREIAARHVIEFQALAAAPDAQLSRPFSVGIQTVDTEVRILLRGPGRVTLGEVTLTDGVTVQALGPGGSLGEAPPTHGLPDLSAKTGELRFRLPWAERSGMRTTAGNSSEA
ncbi:family 20 glycosylhydrolase [Nibricoccus sp. IMCC34717]|uniref:family 20 glycosylhydrolase n=1 Tax=Nibricoccus sp. IMCC34717 TaxID=3034021 RepID=UPI0038513867